MKIEPQVKTSPRLDLHLTEEARKAHFVATGQTVSRLIVHTEDASPELRAELQWLRGPYGKTGEEYYAGITIGTATPTDEEILDAVRAEVEGGVVHVATALQRQAEAVYGAGYGPSVDGAFSMDTEPLRKHPAVLALLAEWEPRIKAASEAWEIARAQQRAADDAANAERRTQWDAEAAAARAAKDAQAAAQAAWVAEHGSPRLQRALEAGYSCAKLYATEVAAHYYPGYVLDWESNVEDKKRSCPSLLGLEAAEKAEKQGEGAEAVVVWIPRQDDLPEGICSGEAVRVRDPRITSAEGGQRDLYRMV